MHIDLTPLCDVWNCNRKATHYANTKIGVMYYCDLHKPTYAQKIENIFNRLVKYYQSWI